MKITRGQDTALVSILLIEAGIFILDGTNYITVQPVQVSILLIEAGIFIRTLCQPPLLGLLQVSILLIEAGIFILVC